MQQKSNFSVWVLLMVVYFMAATALLTTPTVKPEAPEVSPFYTAERLAVRVEAFDANDVLVSTGSGVFNGNYVITARHVLEDAAYVSLSSAYGRKMAAITTGNMYLDTEYDLGVVRLPFVNGIPDDKLFFDTDFLMPGDRLIVAGYPLACYPLILTEGNFGGRAELPTTPWSGRVVLAGLHIAPGNSGGGVYHDNRLVGIVVGNSTLGAISVVVPVEHILEMLERANGQEETKEIVAD